MVAAATTHKKTETTDDRKQSETGRKGTRTARHRKTERTPPQKLAVRDD